MECYSGGNVVGSVFAAIFVTLIVVAVLAWIYRKYYYKRQKHPKLVCEEDPENVKHEFAFDNPAFKGDGGKSSLLNTNWTSPKHQSNEKRKPLDDSHAGVPAPRLVSLKGSDFTGLGIECYGGLKDGIYVKKVAPQGPASGHINIGDRITSLTIDFQHIVQEDAMTILSYASPYNVQLELVPGNKKASQDSASPKPGRQSPLVHPLMVRSSSQSDLNTIERNSRKKLFNNEGSDYPTLKMDKNYIENSASMNEIQTDNERQTPSLMQKFKNQIAKIEEKFQNRSVDKTKTQNLENVEEGMSNTMTPNGSAQTTEQSEQPQSKKGMKFGIRVFPPNVNEKLFGKARSKSPPAPTVEQPEMERKVEEKPKADVTDGMTEVTIECENFNRQNSVTSSGIKRDINGIPQELPDFMANAAYAARDGRKMSTDSDSRKWKGKAPRPPMLSVNLDASTDTVDTNVTDTNITANNTNNVNMEIEDELDRITEKYLSQSKDKLNFSDNFANSTMNKTDESVTIFDKIENMKDEVVLRNKSSTPKTDRKEEQNNSAVLDVSDLDLSNYGNRMELNSSDVTVHQPDEEGSCDDTRRAASLGDLSLMKKSLTEKDGNNMERTQSLDISVDNNMSPTQSLALALSKPTSDLANLANTSSDETMSNNMTQQEITTVQETDKNAMRYPFGNPKSDVLKQILGAAAQKVEVEQEASKSLVAPSIVFMKSPSDAETSVNVPMQSIVTIEGEKAMTDMTKVLSVDTTEDAPVSLTLINNTVEIKDPNHMSPIFSSNNEGVNFIQISSVEFKPIAVSTHENRFNENYFIKDNVVTITTDSTQPSSIQYIDDEKLDFSMMEALEDDDDEFAPKVVETAMKGEKTEENGNAIDSEINNNVSKTTIMNNDDDDGETINGHTMSKFLTEIVFKGDNSDEMTTSEENAMLTSSTVSNESSESVSANAVTLRNVPLSTANFIKHERKHIEKNFIPQSSEIKFTTAIYDSSPASPLSNHQHMKEPKKRMSQIEQIRQNFEMPSSTPPVPVARRSSIPLSIQKTSPSKIPVFNKPISGSKTSMSSRSNSSSKLNNSP